MKNIKIILVILIIITISCNKKEIEQIPDNILYQDLSKTDTVTSIDSFVFVGTYDMNYDCYKPIPEDSVAFVEIDINFDGTNDFVISHSHWYGMYLPETPHKWCQKYQNYKVGIVALNTDNFIICDSTKGFPYVFDAVKSFSSGELINDNYFTKTTGTLYIYSASCMCAYNPDSLNNIIGLIVDIESAKYYAWLSILITENYFKLEDCAINLTKEKGIIAKQTENGN